MVFKNVNQVTVNNRFGNGEDFNKNKRMQNRRYNKNTGPGNNTSKDSHSEMPRPEENKSKHYRVFKPPSVETNHDPQGPLAPKESILLPVPQLQLPGPATAFQPQPGCGDQQQQLPGCYPDPNGLQPVPVNQAPVYPYAMQQYNPYATEGTAQQFQQDGFIQQPASGQVAYTASNGQLFYPGTSSQDIYSVSGGLGYQGMFTGGENVAGGFAGGWANTLDPKGFFNYDQQSLLTPTWSTQDMTGATPGPPGISPGGFQQPAQYPNTPSNNQLPLQQPTGGGAAVTPTTNLVFNFPSVASTNSLCPTAISQDNRSPMFDPSVPPPQPIINYNIQQQDFSYQAQFQGWNRTLISLPEVNSCSSFTSGSYTGLHQYHTLQPMDPAGYSGAQPLPGPCYSTNSAMVGQTYPVCGPGVQVPVSGGQCFVPAQWPTGNEEYYFNLQNYPTQYYGVSANMPLLSQRSDGADSGVVSDFANLTIGDTDESSTSSRRQDEASSKDTSGSSTDKEKQDSNNSNHKERKHSRVVSCTPDIVKSVEENKADDANKSDNNKGDKMTTGEPETKDKTNKAVTEDDPGLNIQASAPAKPALPLPSPNNVQGVPEQQPQGVTYFTYNPYNEQQYTTVTGDCSYPGVPGALQNYVQHPGGGLVQPQQAYPYPQVQNEYTYLNTVGGQAYDQYNMQPQLVTSGHFQQLPGGGQYPAAVPNPVQEDYNNYAAQTAGFYMPAASYPQIQYK